MKAGGFKNGRYGFSADSSDKVSAEEIRRLAFGRTWKGRLENGEPALTQIQTNGKFAFRTPNHIATGRAFVSADYVLRRDRGGFPGSPAVRLHISPRSAQAEDGLDYTYVNAVKVFHFSPNQ